MPLEVKPLKENADDARRRDPIHRVCLTLISVSFLLWLTNSYAISNTIRAVGRLVGKFPGR